VVVTIQALRALAALLVLARHVLPWFPEWGSAGVDIFFPISGFVMVLTTYEIRSDPKNARRFALRRLIRIVPLYWMATIALLIVQRGMNKEVVPVV
jgi:exopolysaccharide production protein ExoZ